MAFKTLKIVERSKIDSDDVLMFDLKININQEGLFTAYLPEDIVKLFDDAGVDLDWNPARRTRSGFFSSQTMQGLLSDVQERTAEYFSREMIEDKIVIRYDIQTTCSYCLSVDGAIVPNGRPEWVLSDSYDWLQGTVEQNSNKRHPYGILIYAIPAKRRTYKYKSGKEKTEYEELYTNSMDKDQEGFLYHLASFVSMKPPGGWHSKLKEIDYTEDAAKFFVNLLTNICRLNERIKDMLDPKSLMKLIESGQKLLGE